jgi:transcriptional regulator with PAS, ATPase and Fis domain
MLQAVSDREVGVGGKVAGVGKAEGSRDGVSHQLPSEFFSASIAEAHRNGKGQLRVCSDWLRMKPGGAESQFAVGSPQNGDVFDDGHPLIGASSLFRHVLSVADAVAENDCVVLLEGESGTGKELLARRIHQRSPRGSSPFIPVNCPAVSESLFESQFYGHVKGAFTGASTDTLGIVRAAEGGTLMLDEVGELPLHLQPKLLRLLQEKEVTPVGGTQPVPVDVRFIAATNRNLARRVAEAEFRSDLYHRLNVVRLVIPPLRSRPEDIEPLLDYYIEYYAQQYRSPRVRLRDTLRRTLITYAWPGNIRELACYVERLYATGLPPMPPRPIQWDDGYVSETPEAGIPPAPGRMPEPDESPVCVTLAEAEAKAIRQALEHTGWNRSAAARLLSIHRSTLLRKIRLHGLDGQTDA